MFKLITFVSVTATDTFFEISDIKEVSPVVINTWVPNGFADAARHAWTVLSSGQSALDAIEFGVSSCEKPQAFSNF